ncbi:HET domain-containing protein [Venturia nashicola]|uniref:HET domain-containing protein n=1 Tax=Venturia nashicola TaxID=86259 RepID=A0A4Z1PE19_9PEZI|nr:HET domain-containing protein [Venturia nashicola]TLD38934.1 HET domain-containing protein [Venturia nashicola]
MRSLTNPARGAERHDSSEVIARTRDAVQLQYAPLPAENWIRYLVLSPGTITDPLRCTLQSIELPTICSFDAKYNDARNELPFEVLSYAWDTIVSKKTLICNGKPLSITVALYDALIRIRLPTASRNLWVYQICVNQQDVQEKGRQVSLMARIHAFAQRTLVWLGPDGGHGDAVASLVKTIGQSGSCGPPMPKSDPLLTDERWNSFKAMRASPWFLHVWGAQEACLGRATWVLYGTTEFSWSSLCQVDDWISKRGKLVADLHQVTPDWIYQKMAWSKPFLHGSNFLRFLEATKYLQATNPSDHIYAVLGSPYTRQPNKSVAGTLDRRNGFVFEPNYEKSHLEVYRDFAVQYLNQIHDMSLLMYIEHSANSFASALPSWVPQWNQKPSNPLPIHIHDLRRDRSIINSTLGEKGALSCRAIKIGQIQFSSPSLLPPESQDKISPDTEKPINQFNDLWKRIHQLFATRRQFWSDIQDSELLRQFASTLLCGREQAMERRLLQAHRTAYCLRLQQRTGAGEVEVEEMARVAKHGDAKFFDDFAAQFYTNRKFAACYEAGKEFFALVPELAEPGDVVCQILGGAHHFVLRKTASEGYFKIIGGAHVKKLGDPKGREPIDDDEIFLN